MSRRTGLALLLVAAALTTVGAGVVGLVRRDRAELVDQFARERLGQLREAVREIEVELGDVGDDLRFAGQLVASADSAADRERELRALLAIVKQYRLVAIHDAEGAAVLSVVDPLAGPDLDPERYAGEMARVARLALARAPGEIETSPPLAGDPTGWLRAFSTPLPTGGAPGRRGTLTILVDTAPFFSRLQLVAAEPGSRLIVLGAHGRPLPMTAPGLAAALVGAEGAAGAAPPSVPELVRRLRAGEEGLLPLDEEGTAALGVGPGELVAAHVPIRMAGARHWSVAALGSTASLRARERRVLLRVGGASAAIVLTLAAFGAYAVVASRRSIAVRERLRHAEAVAHLHEKTEKILDHIPSGVMALSEDGRITALNRALRDRIPATAVGARLASAFPAAPPAVVSRLRDLVESAAATGRVRGLKGEQLALFGAEGRYRIHAIPLEPRAPDARTLLVVEDVSEVHELAAQLLRAEKLATVGVLAAGIAHEVGTPLGVVRARAEIIVGKLGPDHPQTPGARVILEEIDRVTRTIRQLLDFSRVKPAAVSAVSLPAVARAVGELLRFEAERRGVELRLDVPADAPTLAADPDQLQQVLVNLILNACDACARGGAVTIRAAGGAGPSSAPDPGGGRAVRVEVIDDGCGIPEELRLQVFDPFFTTKKRGQGTGLGLTVAAQIVRNHGGAIDLESEPGRGTRVILTWPAAERVIPEAVDARA